MTFDQARIMAALFDLALADAQDYSDLYQYVRWLGYEVPIPFGDNISTLTSTNSGMITYSYTSPPKIFRY